MATRSSQETPWIDISAAADYLGVHFTTLRRWTDDGKVPCIRTPGGRRRYRPAELTAFLAGLRQEKSDALTEASSSQVLAALRSPGHLGISSEPWYSRLGEPQRSVMRNDGQQLMAVLLQYAARNDDGEAFLLEGQRLAAAYGEINYRAGLSLIETLRAFVLVRRAINDSVQQAGALADAPDADAGRLCNRIATFLDAMLLATVEGFESAEARTPPVTHAEQARHGIAERHR